MGCRFLLTSFHDFLNVKVKVVNKSLILNSNFDIKVILKFKKK